MLRALTCHTAERYFHGSVHGPSGGIVVGIDTQAQTLVVAGAKGASQPVVGHRSTALDEYKVGARTSNRAGRLLPMTVAIDRTTGVVYTAANVLPAVAFFFDFDGTISVSMWVERLQNFAVSDANRRHIIEQLSPDEVVQNYGGAERLAALTAFLGELRSRGAKLFVISHGMASAIRPHLAQVELEGYFHGIFGTDSPELRACGGGHADKAKLIAQLMAQLQLTPETAAFFEDTQANLVPAEGVCGCHLVGRGGLDAAGMDAVIGHYFKEV